MSALRKRPRLIILDSHAIIHRAYHALPDFSTSKGEPTGALYGLISMLLRAVEDLRPDFVIACRDLPGPTHRHEAYERYKATRKEAEDALIVQLQAAPEVFTAFGIPNYAAPGYEADDCIGTLVHAFKEEPIDIVIVSGDMDTLQLVSKQVTVYTLRKGLNDTITYDSDRVHERYGFGPEHVVDYKALRGDPSDNIPGIRGIGEKTAETLVTEFGSLEDIYEALEAQPDVFEDVGIKKRVLELLRTGKADAEFSKQLATIRADAPINPVLPSEPWSLSQHVDSIVALCDKYEFRSLRERVKSLVRKHIGNGAGAATHASLFSSSDAEDVSVDPVLLRETAIALWLLHSDTTSPTLDDILAYAHTDDFATARDIVMRDLTKESSIASVFEMIEKPLIPVVERMNADGIKLDVSYLHGLSKEYGTELASIAQRIFAAAGHEFNINSPKQLGDVIFDELKLSLPRQKRTATGARTTREEELSKMKDQHPIIGEILAYRELQKLLSTYIDKMGDMVGADGRLHAEFLQAGTTTGRMSSQNPNLQNIPIRTDYGRRIRSAFVASEGCSLVALDYSQIELRIAAGLSGDTKLISVFQEGGDIHTSVAAAVFGVSPQNVDREMRRRAKVINFGILYGMGVNALRSNLGDDVSREDAGTFLEGYFAAYPTLSEFIARTKSSAAQRGFTETLFGRRRYFPGLRSPLPNIRAQAERMAVNAPIQGTQADIIKLAMVECDRLIEKEGVRENVRLILQVHDELVYEMDDTLAQQFGEKVRHVMESVAPIEKLNGVPVRAEMSIGRNWGEMKRV